jgi:citrate lyase subunit beta / citryl-CoA lyase
MAMRSWLFVPADSERKLAKVAGCGADCIIIDLEDSVAADRKTHARAIARNWLSQANPPGRIYVRVNALSTGMTAADCAIAALPGVHGIVLPKAEGGASVAEADVMLRVAEAEADREDGSLQIMAIATETARGVMAAGRYGAASPRLSALAWGVEDLGAEIGAHSARDALGALTPLFAHARTMTLLGAADAGVAAIDGIFADYRDEAGLAAECSAAMRDGFAGKLAIHPAQVPVINAAMQPSPAVLDHARAVVAAFDASGGAGVISLDGRMLDLPHLKLAKRILAAGSW